MNLPDRRPPQEDDPVADLGEEQPFLTHLIELRSRILRALAAVVIIFIPLAIYANDLFTLVATPLLSKLPPGSHMIATEVTSPFLTPFRLAFMVALFLAMPFILWQIWAFIAPGLYQHERRFVMPLMLMSTVLFYSGVAFAYFLVMPIIFGFMTHVVPQGVAVMTDMSHYLSFATTLFLAFGVVFEIPVAVILLVWAGITTPGSLAALRPYVLVGAFVVAMFLTPPDAFSQTMLAVPTYLLYELGIFLSRIMVPGYKEVEAQRKQ